MESGWIQHHAKSYLMGVHPLPSHVRVVRIHADIGVEVGVAYTFNDGDRTKLLSFKAFERWNFTSLCIRKNILEFLNNISLVTN